MRTMANRKRKAPRLKYLVCDGCGERVLDGLIRCGNCGRAMPAMAGYRSEPEWFWRDASGRRHFKTPRTCASTGRAKDRTGQQLSERGMLAGYNMDSGSIGRGYQEDDD